MPADWRDPCLGTSRQHWPGAQKGEGIAGPTSHECPPLSVAIVVQPDRHPGPPARPHGPNEGTPDAPTPPESDRAVTSHAWRRRCLCPPPATPGWCSSGPEAPSVGSCAAPATKAESAGASHEQRTTRSHASSRPTRSANRRYRLAREMPRAKATDVRSAPCLRALVATSRILASKTARPRTRARSSSTGFTGSAAKSRRSLPHVPPCKDEAKAVGSPLRSRRRQPPAWPPRRRQPR